MNPIIWPIDPIFTIPVVEVRELPRGYVKEVEGVIYVGKGGLDRLQMAFSRPEIRAQDRTPPPTDSPDLTP